MKLTRITPRRQAPFNIGGGLSSLGTNSLSSTRLLGYPPPLPPPPGGGYLTSHPSPSGAGLFGDCLGTVWGLFEDCLRTV